MRDLVQFDILISCPSDIENRGFINTIKEIVYNFNTNYGFKIGVSIRILYWKDSSYPEYGDTPQDIINRQIVDNADAVIAVFGNVFGTATSRYGSGTEEEIEKMISSGKQIFLYFENKRTETNNLILEEVQRVRDFKKKYGEKGLYTEFKSKPQFKQLLLEHLISYFTNNPLVDARDKGWPHIVTKYEIQFCYTDSSEILVKKILTIRCYGGLDLSSTTDITAFVLVFPPTEEDDKYIVLPYFWIPEDTLDLRVRKDHVPYDLWKKKGYLQTTEGNVVHYGFIEKFIEELGEKFNIREIAFDRWGAVQMVQNLEDMGFTVVPLDKDLRICHHRPKN